MDFKKILPVLALFILLSPFHAQAAITVPWNATSTDIGYTSPTRVNGNDPIVQASSYAATNTAATSTLLNTSVNQFKIAALSGILKAVSGIVSTATAGTDYLTSNQTITLSGDVSGSGSTAIATVIGALKVLNSMIANGTIDLTTKVTGLLPVANGGTGSSTLSGILIGNGTSPVNTLTIGSNLSLVGTTLSATGGGGTGLSTTTPISGSNVLVYSAAGAGAAYGAATTSATCAGTVSCTSFNVLGPSPITITGSGGSGTYPFTPATNFGVGMSATTTGLWGQGGIYASSSTAYPTLAVKQAGAGFAATFDGGNVGIGTTSPAALLSVNGVTNAGVSATPLTLLVQGATASLVDAGGITLIGGAAASNVGGQITLAGGSGLGGGSVVLDGGVGSLTHGNVLLNTINTGARLGIGVSSPGASVDIKGVSALMPFRVSSSTGASLFEVEQNNNIGIGTTTAHALVSANAGTNSIAKNLLELSYSTGATDAATTTVAALASSTVSTLLIGTTTPALGSQSATTTIYMQKLQFQGGNSAGVTTCAYVNSSNAFTVQSGPCN